MQLVSVGNMFANGKSGRVSKSRRKNISISQFV